MNVYLFVSRWNRFKVVDGDVSTATISIDVIRMKSYVDSLLDPTFVSVRVTINKP